MFYLVFSIVERLSLPKCSKVEFGLYEPNYDVIIPFYSVIRR